MPLADPATVKIANLLAAQPKRANLLDTAMNTLGLRKKRDTRPAYAAGGAALMGGLAAAGAAGKKMPPVHGIPGAAAAGLGAATLGAGAGYALGDKSAQAQVPAIATTAAESRKPKATTDYSRSLVNQFRPDVDAAGRRGAVGGGAAGAALLGLVARMVTDNPAVVGGSAALGGGIGALAGRNAARADAGTQYSRLLAMRRGGMDNPADLYMALHFPALVSQVTTPGQKV